MILVLSPSKSQDFSRPSPEVPGKISKYMAKSALLMDELKTKSESQLMELMGISKKLATLNYQRFQDWNEDFSTKEVDLDGNKRALHALMAFTGDVYRGFTLERYGKEDYAFAEKHIRILSGLYGILSPLTLIKPYRLEMSIKLPVEDKGKSYETLHDFWKADVTSELNALLKKEKVLLNLASKEYMKAVNRRSIQGEIIDIDFKIKKEGAPRTVAIIAKRHRGLMASWIVEARVDDVQKLKTYSKDGFSYSEEYSKEGNMVFVKQG